MTENKTSAKGCPQGAKCPLKTYLCSQDDFANDCFIKVILTEKDEAQNQCESWKSLIDEAQLEQRKLEQQLVQLKERLKTLDSEDVTYQLTEAQYKEYENLKTDNEELKGIRDRNFLHALEEQKRADKYFKTLTEIKVFLEYEFYGENIWVKEKILQKINEVVDD